MILMMQYNSLIFNFALTILKTQISIMKKILFLAVIAVFGLTSVNAQEESTFGFTTGDIFIEGNVSFGSLTDEDTIGGSTSETKTSNFNLSPKAGYFISDGFAIGIELSIGSTKQEAEGTDTLDQSLTAFGVFGRYYFLPLGERFKPFTEFGVGFGSGSDDISNVDITSLGFGAGLGVNYFLTENWALSFNLRNILSYTSTKSEVDGVDGDTTISEFDFGFGDVSNPFGSDASFGILYKF